MCLSKSTSAVLLLSFTLLLHASFGAEPLKHDCSIIKFMGDKQYESNVNEIMDRLKEQTPPKGYSQISVGNLPNRVYGQALCRGDLKTKYCKACVAEASKEIKNLCPDTRMAIIWYDNCMLRYSYLDFFGQVDYINYYSRYNTYNKIKYEQNFSKSRDSFLNQLVYHARTNPKLFATGMVKVGHSKLYGMAQCTRDLSRFDCKECLTTAVKTFRNSNNDKSTGWFAYGSCSLRFEAYPFVKV